MEPLLEIQKKGPIDIIIGKFGATQKVFKVVFVVASIALDNEEAYKIQGLSFGYRCPSNCRLCSMPTNEFYSFSSFGALFDVEYQDGGNLTPIQLLDLYNIINGKLYKPRNTEDNTELSKQAEDIWWKQVLFNKNIMGRGQKVLHLTAQEKDLCQQVKSKNLKCMDNIIMSSILQPFFTRNGRRQQTIIPGDWVFSPDKMHTLWKGPIEYCLRYSVICLMLQGQHDVNYRDNISAIDIAILDFDVYQPVTNWGNIPARRLSGISGKLYNLVVLINYVFFVINLIFYYIYFVCIIYIFSYILFV